MIDKNKVVEAVIKWLVAQSEFEAAVDEARNLVKPVKPTMVTVFSDMDRYLESLDRFDRSMASVNETEKGALKTQDFAKSVIISELPSNVWFMVTVNKKDYAVGHYTDAWGGNHQEIRIIEWEDSLAPLRDRLDYN